MSINFKLFLVMQNKWIKILVKVISYAVTLIAGALGGPTIGIS